MFRIGYAADIVVKGGCGLPWEEVAWSPPERRQRFNGRDWFEARKIGGS